MKIQLLYFAGCPNVEASRVALREALVAEHLDGAIEEIDVEDPAAPDWVRGWGSPTILIDGRDVAGQRPSTSWACRLYADGGPSGAMIRERLVAARSEGIALPTVTPTIAEGEDIDRAAIMGEVRR